MDSRANHSQSVILQEIDARLICVKGIGKDHAKFSPVGKWKPKCYVVQVVILIIPLLTM